MWAGPPITRDQREEHTRDLGKGVELLGQVSKMGIHCAGLHVKQSKLYFV